MFFFLFCWVVLSQNQPDNFYLRGELNVTSSALGVVRSMMRTVQKAVDSNGDATLIPESASASFCFLSGIDGDELFDISCNVVRCGAEFCVDIGPLHSAVRCVVTCTWLKTANGVPIAALTTVPHTYAAANDATFPVANADNAALCGVTGYTVGAGAYDSFCELSYNETLAAWSLRVFARATCVTVCVRVFSVDAAATRVERGELFAPSATFDPRTLTPLPNTDNDTTWDLCINAFLFKADFPPLSSFGVVGVASDTQWGVANGADDVSDDTCAYICFLFTVADGFSTSTTTLTSSAATSSVSLGATTTSSRAADAAASSARGDSDVLSTPWLVVIVGAAAALVVSVTATAAMALYARRQRRVDRAMRGSSGSGGRGGDARASGSGLTRVSGALRRSSRASEQFGGGGGCGQHVASIYDYAALASPPAASGGDRGSPVGPVYAAPPVPTIDTFVASPPAPFTAIYASPPAPVTANYINFAQQDISATNPYINWHK